MTIVRCQLWAPPDAVRRCDSPPGKASQPMSDGSRRSELRQATDEALVARVVAGRGEGEGRAAAHELFGRYQERIYRWCYRMVREHERALDLAQEAQLNAYRALASFRADARFSSWLFSIVRHRCLSALRPVSLLVEEGTEPDDLVDGAPSPYERLEEEEGLERLQTLMARTLCDEERRALALRCFERLPVDEITRLMGLDSATGARGLLQRARRKLRAALARDRQGEGTP